MFRILRQTVLPAMLVLFFALPANAQETSFNQLIKDALSRTTAKAKAPLVRLKSLRAWYAETDYNPVWVRNGAPSEKARILVEVLATADEDALDPKDYNTETLRQLLEDPTLEGRAKLEVGLSRSLIAYGQHLNAGRVRPNAVNREIVIYPKAVAIEAVMFAAIQSDNLPATLEALAPSTPRYARMRNHLLNLRFIAQNGGWIKLPKGPLLKPGMREEIVPLLAERLVQSGDLVPGIDYSGLEYDDALVTAVKSFQRRLGLEADGVVGPGTYKSLDISVEQRIRTVELNMERRRWMQDNYGPYYVFANLADQVLKVVHNEKTIHTALIQVGKPFHRTPVFTDAMEYVELNPYWNVPYSIATKEYLPKLKRNPGVLDRQNIEVLQGGRVVSAYSVPWSSYSRGRFPFRLRQKPGKRNALGRIKFMFPNKYNIYIHDTPSKANFSRASRYFSHGCMRVKDPLKLAEVILGRDGWTRKKINRVVRSGKRTVKRLGSKIPVHVAYLTAWVNKDGSVYYRRDVYGRDKILDKALKKVRGY